MMALQIEEPEVIQLVEELSRRTGESPEAVVEAAVREQLKRYRAVEARIAHKAELQALVDSLATRFKASGQTLIDHGELLYGEDGLPR